MTGWRHNKRTWRNFIERIHFDSYHNNNSCIFPMFCENKSKKDFSRENRNVLICNKSVESKISGISFTQMCRILHKHKKKKEKTFSQGQWSVHVSAVIEQGQSSHNALQRLSDRLAHYKHVTMWINGNKDRSPQTPQKNSHGAPECCFIVRAVQRSCRLY